MKRCCACKQLKELSDFNKCKARKDGLNNKCRKCDHESSRKTYLKRKVIVLAKTKERFLANKQFIDDIKAEKKCKVCKEDDPCCLDFHHSDPSVKEEAIGRLRNRSKETILKEIEKCVVVCSNCHRKIHAGKIQMW